MNVMSISAVAIAGYALGLFTATVIDIIQAILGIKRELRRELRKTQKMAQQTHENIEEET